MKEQRQRIIKLIHLLCMVLVVALPLLGACQKEELNEDELRCPVTATSGANDNVIGKWKMVKAQGSMMIPSRDQQRKEDYSCNNIIYHFTEGGSLTISGVHEGALSLENGERPFEFEDIPFLDGMDGTYTLKIGTMKWICDIKNNTMILDASPLDGGTWYFIRIE